MNAFAQPLNAEKSSRMDQFWHQQAHYFEFIGEAGLRLKGVQVTHPQGEQKPLIVLVSGRTESTIKYQEVFYDLFQQGYSIVSYDHRGQGESERLLSDSFIGHVAHFDDYQLDLARFLQQLPNPHQQPLVMVAHSMGGLVALDYVRKHPQHGLKKLVLLSPMLQIHTGFVPHGMACFLSRMLDRTTGWFEANDRYYPGQGQPEDILDRHLKLSADSKPFVDNPLTQDFARFSRFVRTWQQNPTLALGGPSIRWVATSCATGQEIMKQIYDDDLPILMLSALADEVVNSQAHVDFVQWQRQQGHRHIHYQGIESARHELLIEKEHMRQPALNALLQFIGQP